MIRIRLTSGLCLGLALAALFWATPTQAAQTISAAGITEPFLDSIVGTPVSGILTVRRFKEGDFVKKGEVVIEFDKALEELDLARREVVLEPLKADFEANKTLYQQPKSSVSKEMLDKKEADYRVALAEYELAKETLHRRLMLAPFDGFITEFFHEVGESCQTLQPPLFRLVDTRQCYFVANVEARSGHGLKVGQKVDLEIEAGLTAVLAQGTISFVSPVVDPASGLLKIKALFDNADGKVRPGVAGKMTFEEGADVSARK